MEADRLQPCQLRHYIVGPYVSPLKVSPTYMSSLILGGRSTPQLIDSYLAVIETAKIINMLMGKPPFTGVARGRASCLTKRK